MIDCFERDHIIESFGIGISTGAIEVPEYVLSTWYDIGLSSDQMYEMAQIHPAFHNFIYNRIIDLELGIVKPYYSTGETVFWDLSAKAREQVRSFAQSTQPEQRACDFLYETLK